MNNAVDYALQQGDSFGVFLWFAILTLFVVLFVIIVLIMAFQIIKGIYGFIKDTFLQYLSNDFAMCFHKFQWTNIS